MHVYLTKINTVANLHSLRSFFISLTGEQFHDAFWGRCSYSDNKQVLDVHSHLSSISGHEFWLNLIAHCIVVRNLLYV